MSNVSNASSSVKIKTVYRLLNRFTQLGMPQSYKVES